GSPSDWSRDGQWIALYGDTRSPRSGSIKVASAPHGPVLDFMESPFAVSSPRFSPDAKWIAYASNESGRYEVYVRPFAGRPAAASDTKIQVSTTGGDYPVWKNDGKELFFLAADLKLYSVQIADFQRADAAPLSAQDLTITNARIIVANGTVIERGSIVVRARKIVSVTPGGPTAASGVTIDAQGMTAMPGFIDAHRHINTGPNEKAQMPALLEAGYTTVLSGGGPAEGNITLRDHIEKGLINGPRIIPSGSLRLNNNTPETARAEIRKMAEMGIKFTGEIGLTPVPGPT